MKVFIIAAITADGFIGLDSSHTADWTSKEDKQLFVKLTKEAGVMIMGSKTFDTIGRALPERKTIVITSNPAKYDFVDGEVLATNESPQKVLDSLRLEGYQSVAICGGSQIYSLFLKEKLVDEIYLTIEPILFGQGLSFTKAILETKLQLLDHDAINKNAVLLHYKVLKR